LWRSKLKEVGKNMFVKFCESMKILLQEILLLEDKFISQEIM